MGRDIGALSLMIRPYVSKILGYTYCPIVLRDCEENWKKHVQYLHSHTDERESLNKAEYYCEPRKSLHRLFPRELSDVYQPMSDDEYIILWSSGRHGLRREELQWLQTFKRRYTVRCMIYISCNIKTLSRDLKWIRENVDITMEKIVTLNQFPNTDYMETIVFWS
jgi:hypothetical protein